MRVTWPDLGKPERPGTYVHQGCEVFVDQNAINVWRKHPDASFKLRITNPLDAGTRKGALGDYDVPGDNTG